MSTTYTDDDLLLLSGIQHMAFCERQWALIHIEQVWAENVRTIEGKHLHERSDDPFADSTRKDVRTVRAMPLVSYRLGLSGVADVVEFQKAEEFQEGITVCLTGKRGCWHPYPVEYKRGRPKKDDRDAVQLCAQAIALEEMLKISVPTGCLFYGQTRRRETVFFNEVLRNRVEILCEEMHRLFAKGRTPPARKGKHCSLCSLEEICQPKLTLRRQSVTEYLARMTQIDMRTETKGAEP